MNEVVKVAAAQVSPYFLDKEKTIDKACKIIEEVANNGAQLVVFPEAFVPGYPDWTWLIPNHKGADLNKLYVKLVENAISIQDKHTKLLCDAARKNKIYVVIGVNERNSEASNASLYNSILFIDDQGEIMGVHRKLIPTGGERLIWSQGDGSTLHVFDTKIGKLGGLICWENFMPLARYSMYQKGTQILAAPTWDKSPKWLSSIQFIAREGGMFVISVCQGLKKDDIPDEYDFKKNYPADREWINSGNSCIVNPKGDIIAGPLENEKGILYAELDLSEILSSKRLFDVTGNYSRPDVFTFEINK
ncbi:MAG: carbon-nitrogen hydrolase family protein [Candidatus Heimdallarchaeaceae archaeon]